MAKSFGSLGRGQHRRWWRKSWLPRSGARFCGYFAFDVAGGKWGKVDTEANESAVDGLDWERVGQLARW